MKDQEIEVVKPHRIWNILLWIVQVIFGVMFILIGLDKSFTAMPELIEEMPWAADLDGALVRFIGIAELVGGIGLMLPAATRVFPQLTIIAAGGIALMMMLAAIFHLSRNETLLVTYNVLPFLAGIFVMWGRWMKYPIKSGMKADTSA